MGVLVNVLVLVVCYIYAGQLRVPQTGKGRAVTREEFLLEALDVGDEMLLRIFCHIMLLTNLLQITFHK